MYVRASTALAESLLAQDLELRVRLLSLCYLP